MSISGQLGEAIHQEHLTLMRVFDEMLSLSVQTEVSLSDAERYGPLLESMRRPYLISVLGEVNVGKSALINALLGVYLCPVSDLPETKTPTRYHFAEDKRQSEEEGWVDCGVPLHGLRSLEWMDFSGIERASKELRQTWQSWLEKSDLLLMVLHHRNPWSAHPWDFLARLDEGLLERVAIVVQACDETEDSNFELLRNHVRELSCKRLSRELPIFLVSSRQAFQSKTQGSKYLLQEDQEMASLENWINRQLLDQPARAFVRSELRQLFAKQLSAIDEHLQAQQMLTAKRVGDLDRIEREIDQLLHGALLRHASSPLFLCEDFAKHAETMEADLRSRLSIMASLRDLHRGIQISDQVDQLMNRRMSSAILDAMTQELAVITNHMESHYHIVSMRHRDFSFLSHHSCQKMLAVLRQESSKVMDRMAKSTENVLFQMQMRSVLIVSLNERNTGLSIWWTLFLISMIVAGFTGFAQMLWTSCVFLMIALALWIILLTFARKNGADIRHGCAERFAISAMEIARDLRKPYEENLSQFFDFYRLVWDPLRMQIDSENRSQDDKRMALLQVRQLLEESAPS